MLVSQDVVKLRRVGLQTVGWISEGHLRIMKQRQNYWNEEAET